MTARTRSVVSKRLPHVARAVVLLALAGALVGTHAVAGQPLESSGAWTAAATFDGSVSPGETRQHALVLSIPASSDAEGLRFDAVPPQLSLRSTGALDGQPVRVRVLDMDARLRAEVVIDPKNPMSHPHGPPLIRLDPGEYRLEVRAAGDAEATYRVVATVTMPFTAARGGLLVSAPALLVPAAVLAAVAIAPGVGWAIANARLPGREAAPIEVNP